MVHMSVRVGSVPAPPAPSQFPDGTTTGVVASLTDVTSNLTLSTSGDEWENRDHIGFIVVTAPPPGALIRNVRLASQSFWGIRVAAGARAVIQDVEVLGDPNGTGCIWANGGEVHVLRANCHGAEDGIRLEGNNCTVRDSYVHDLASSDPGSAHYDGMNADGYTGWEITGNTILNPHPQTSGLYIGDDTGSPPEGLLQGNLLAGGGYTIYAGPSSGAGLRVRDNAISTRYFENGGSLSYLTDWVAANNLWSGNYWYDDFGAAGSPRQYPLGNGPRAGQPVST